jgi:hypothetical protein
MARVSMTNYENASPEVRAAYDEQVAKNGRITNMKRTLLHSVPAYHAYMEWYTLRDEILPIIGERGVVIFSHAISTGSHCLICSTFFRRYLIDAGEDPNHLTLNEREQLLVDYGRHFATNANAIPEDIYQRLAANYNETELLQLTAFAGIMVATNLLNNALQIPLDEVLYKYKDTAAFGA